MKYKLAIYIGRFQPLHNAHLGQIEQGLKIADELLLILGSVPNNEFGSAKNPFNFDERVEFIKAAVPKEELKRIHIKEVEDCLSDEEWFQKVKEIISEYKNLYPICLIGHLKDKSSYYLTLFPWPLIHSELINLSGTDIRNKIFLGDETWKENVHPEVAKLIENGYIGSEDFFRHQEEFYKGKNNG
jgi:bifunctional NMN adenylyltransferase/nudix hydrolase